jgi:protein disulfide-isomerase A1
VRRMVAAKVPRVFVFDAFDSPGVAEARLLAAMAVAAAAHPELNFIAADAAQNKDTVSFFTLTRADLPAAVVHDTSSGDKKYTRPRITPDGLEAFLSDFQAGALAPIVKSAPIPVANSAPVTVLVADNFEAAVGVPAAAGKTFLIYFYATWCEPCQTMAPVYEEVGEHFAGRDDVVIAKMDADANTVTLDRFKVMRFPTLYLQTSSGEALRYTGERTKEALTAFVEHFAAAAAKGTLVGAAAAAELQAEL